MSKQAVEIVCGLKLKGVSGRRVHSLRRPAMKAGPVTVIKYDKIETEGETPAIREMLIEKGARDPQDVIRDSKVFA